MNLQHLALFFIGAGLPYLTAGVIIRLIEGKYIDDDDDDDDVDTHNKERTFKGHYESREFIGYVAVSIGVLLYIAYRIFQAG